MRDVMLSQDCLYALVKRSLEGDQARMIGSIVNFLNAAHHRNAVARVNTDLIRKKRQSLMSLVAALSSHGSVPF